MHSIVDFFMPKNCRKAVTLAAARNKAVLADALDLLGNHRSHITRAMKEDRRRTPR